MSVELSSIVEQGSRHVATCVEGEVVMMSIEKGNYYGLDAVGSRIWTLIAQPRKVCDLCDLLLSEFNVDRATCEADVLRFLNDMEAQGLIETRGA